MGEMADLFLSSQDDIDFYEDFAMQGYKVPDYAMRMPTLDREPLFRTTMSKAPSARSKPSYHKKRTCPAGCWVDKNGEVQEISKMTDQYINNLIGFLEKNPLLIQQNCAAFEQMIEERYKRNAKRT